MGRLSNIPIVTTNPYIPFIADEDDDTKVDTPPLLDIANADPKVKRIKEGYYGLLADLQHFVDHKTYELQRKKMLFCINRDSMNLQQDISDLEEQIKKLIAHRKAISCCSSWGIDLVNINDPELQYKKPIPCRRSFCPNCSEVGSDTHILRCQKGWNIIKQCEKGSVDIGHMVWTTPPEVRKGLLEKKKVTLLQKAVVNITRKYLGIGGFLCSFHYFGEPSEDGYADYAPHVNLLFPLKDKHGNKLTKYKLTELDLYQMKQDYAKALVYITGIELENPVNQDTREEELTIYYRWFCWDGEKWMGKNKGGHMEEHNMHHLVYYDLRSTISPTNLIKQGDDVKEFVYFEMVGFHLSRGFGSLCNHMIHKYLLKLNPLYVKDEKKSFKCLVDESRLQVKKLHGSNKALISSIRTDSNIISISENIEESNTKLYANSNVVYTLMLKSIGYFAFHTVVLNNLVTQLFCLKSSLGSFIIKPLLKHWCAMNQNDQMPFLGNHFLSKNGKSKKGG